MKPQLLKPIRVFFAVTLNEKNQGVFQKIMDTLRKYPDGKHIRWTNPKKLHITVRFIGNISPTQVPVLAEKIQRAIRSIPPFKIQFDKIMLFPSKLKPQVLAADVQYSQMLQNLFEIVEKAVVDFGLPPEKRIQRPHLTLGHFKAGQVPNIDINLANLNINMMVDNLTLIQSIAQEKGKASIYQTIERIILASG